ncbi:hypothetical protein [Burkholderia cenocepacia]|uniref:hypothetical protein n=1 Tax=Burkholderia cenocepacia TaxID=95486 RepID=UPI00117868B1|nr:hypothetical protein [Burkholderia cenocepacia]
MDLQKYEQLLHDATVIFCKKNGYWFYGSKNDDDQAILVNTEVSLHKFHCKKYEPSQVINLTDLFKSLFPEQISLYK